MNRTDSRITSACSDAITLSTACAAVILPTSAIVVLLLRQSLGRDRRFEAPGGRPSSRPASARCYTTSTDSTERPHRLTEHPINHHVADPPPQRIVDRDKAG